MIVKCGTQVKARLRPVKHLALGGGSQDDLVQVAPDLRRQGRPELGQAGDPHRTADFFDESTFFVPTPRLENLGKLPTALSPG